MVTHESTPTNYNLSYPTPEASDTHLGTLEHIEGKKSFELRFTQEDRATFANLIGKVSLDGAMSALRPIVASKELRGKTFSEAEYDMVELIASTIESSDVDIEVGSDIRFRWVSATDKTGVEQLRESARITGGAEPGAPWTHIGTSVVGDFMTQNSSNLGAGVLFIYDGTKLTPPSEEEFREQEQSGGKIARMYATKAKPGYELKDAVIGTISFE